VATKIQQKRGDARRMRRRRVGRIRRFFRGLGLVLLLAAGIGVWQAAWLVDRAAHEVLASAGFGDVAFRVRVVRPWEIALADVRFEDAAGLELGGVDCVRVCFSPQGLLARRIDQVRIEGVRTTVVLGADGVRVPLVEQIRPRIGLARGATADRPGTVSRPWQLERVWMGPVDVAVQAAGADQRVETVSGTVRADLARDGRYDVALQAGLRDTPVTAMLAGQVDPATLAGAVEVRLSVGDAGVTGLLARAEVCVPAARAWAGRLTMTGATAWRGEVVVASGGKVESIAVSGGSEACETVAGAMAGQGSAVVRDVQAQAVWRAGQGTTGSARLTVVRAEVEQFAGRTIEQATVAMDGRFGMDGALSGRVALQAAELPAWATVDGLSLRGSGWSLWGEADGKIATAGWVGTWRGGSSLRRVFARANGMRVNAARSVEATAGGTWSAAGLGDSILFAVRADDAAVGWSGGECAVSLRGGGAIDWRQGTLAATNSWTVMQARGGVFDALRLDGDRLVCTQTTAVAWRDGVSNLCAVVAVAADRVGWSTPQVTGDIRAVAQVGWTNGQASAWLATEVGHLVPRLPEGVIAAVERVDLRVDLPSWCPAAGVRPELRGAMTVSGVSAAMPGQGVAVENGGLSVSDVRFVADKLPVFGSTAVSWTRATVRGIEVKPSDLAVVCTPTNGLVSFALAVAGSTAMPRLTLDLPFARPEQFVVGFELPAFELRGDDAVRTMLRAQLPDLGVEGRIGARGRIEFGGVKPYTRVSAELADGTIAAKGWQVAGCAGRVVLEGRGRRLRTTGRPFLAFDGLTRDEIRFGAGRIDFRWNPDELFIERAEVAFADGHLQAHGLHIAPTDPDLDFTLYADRVDAGRILRMFPAAFQGEATGRLYGQIPLRVAAGRVHLTQGFLYSLPGEGGTIRMGSPTIVAALLARAGIQAGIVRDQMAEALHDVDFSMARIDLDAREPDAAVLTIRLKGQSNSTVYPAPVDITTHVRGPVEALLNIGLSTARNIR